MKISVTKNGATDSNVKSSPSVPKSSNTIKINTASKSATTPPVIAAATTTASSNNNNTKTENKKDIDTENDGNTDKIRGYKLTTDGRKTTFFNNEMDEQTKALIGDIAPQKISVRCV